MSLNACPSCGFNMKQGLLTGSYFHIYRCAKCRHSFCYKCTGSNDGRKCPRCSASEKQQIDTVYLRS